MGLIGWHQEVAHLSSLDWRSQLSYPCVDLPCCFQPIRKWYYRLVHLTGWFICFKFVRFGRTGIRWGGCLSVVMLNGFRWCWHLIINFLSRPQCMNNITLIQWLILSQMSLLRIPRFIIGWLGKVPFCLSFCGLANWFIWTSSLCTVCMRESWFFMYLSIFLSKSVILLSSWGSGRKIMELGWESFVNSLKNWADGWENYDGNRKSWVDN